MNYRQSSAVFFAPPPTFGNDTSSRYAQPATPSQANRPSSLQDPSTASRVVLGVVDTTQKIARVSTNSSDVAVHPGQYLSAKVVAREKMRDLLITSVHRFAAETSDAYRVSAETAEASVGLIKALRGNMELPKIAPDGEGGLMVFWEARGAPLALVVDNWKMHMVTGAATPDAEYFDDLPFDGLRLPEQLAASIPKA